MAVPPTAPSAKLQELTPDIYIQHPFNDASTAGQGTDPQLVVMCGWMDARLAHLEKYSSAYRLLFPAATILILRSRQSTFYSFRSSAKALEPAVRVVQQQIGPSSAQLKLPTTPPPSILVHAFSNGGCRSVMQLDEQLRRLNPDGLQAKAVSVPSSSAIVSELTRSNSIFDSCPGNTSLTIMVRAFTAPIKSRLLKIPASGLVALLYLIGGIVNLYVLLLFFSVDKAQHSSQAQRDRLDFLLPPHQIHPRTPSLHLLRHRSPHPLPLRRNARPRIPSKGHSSYPRGIQGDGSCSSYEGSGERGEILGGGEEALGKCVQAVKS